MNLDSFTQVDTINPRKSSADISYSGKTGKFTVSESLYDRLNLADYGFALYISNSEKRIALAIVKNEDASIMKGKRGFAKGRQFTASALVTAMQSFMPDVNEFSLQYMISNGGIEYYEMTPVTENTSGEDVIHDDDEQSQDIPDEEGERDVAQEEVAF